MSGHVSKPVALAISSILQFPRSGDRELDKSVAGALRAKTRIRVTGNLEAAVHLSCFTTLRRQRSDLWQC
jgi:hypothetical protein